MRDNPARSRKEGILLELSVWGSVCEKSDACQGLGSGGSAAVTLYGLAAATLLRCGGLAAVPLCFLELAGWAFGKLLCVCPGG